MQLRVNIKGRITHIISVLLLGLFIACTQTMAQAVESKPLSVSQTERETVEKIIREYLLKDPTVVRDALQELQAREEREKAQLVEKNLKAFNTELYGDIESPTAGNKGAEVPIVVFYDYHCGYCRKNLPELEKLRAKDPSIRVVYKELPILGPQSYFAALAALAANRQGKFAEFHQALLASNAQFDEAGITEIAKRLGMNSDLLEKDMKDPKLNDVIVRSEQLATALNINGTPGYIVGSQIVPGAIDLDTLEKLVAAERAKLPKTPANTPVAANR